MELEKGNQTNFSHSSMEIHHSLCSNDLFAGSQKTTGGFTVKAGLAKMAKGGLIMDVVNAEQAKIAEDAGVRFYEF